MLCPCVLCVCVSAYAMCVLACLLACVLYNLCIIHFTCFECFMIYGLMSCSRTVSVIDMFFSFPFVSLLIWFPNFFTLNMLSFVSVCPIFGALKLLLSTIYVFILSTEPKCENVYRKWFNVTNCGENHSFVIIALSFVCMYVKEIVYCVQ